MLGAINWRRNRVHAHRPEALQRLVEDLKAQAIDHIAVSGDLVNLGLPEEHARAAAWLASLGPPDRVSAVPGNHDIYVRMPDALGIGRWSQHMTSNAGGLERLPELQDGFPYVRRLADRIVLIGLNSALPRPPFYASGRLGSQQRVRLKALLSSMATAGLVRVVMIHHPPLPHQAPARKGLDDAVELADILADAGCELVLHGHNHRNMLTRLAQRHGPDIPIIGVASASMGHLGKEPLARYNLMHFDFAAARCRIELVGRGLARPDGPIIELERREIAAMAR